MGRATSRRDLAPHAWRAWNAALSCLAATRLKLPAAETTHSTSGPRTARAGSKKTKKMARAFLLAAATLACAAALAPPKTHVAPVSAGPVPAALAAAVPAIAAQPASAAVLGLKIPLLGQAGLVFAPVLLVAAPIALIVIGNGALQQLRRSFDGTAEKYTQNEN